MIIDGHAHLWQPGRGFDIKPIADQPAFRRDFLLPELAAQCRRCGIDRVVITQSAPQPAETEFLLELCRDQPLVAGVTGWVDLAAADIADMLARLCAEPKFIGIRAQLRRIAEDGFILRPQVRHGIETVAARGLSIVLLAEARHHRHCLALLDALPDLSVILNHGGMPDLLHGDMEQWRRTMAEYATRTTAVTQLSGFVSLGGPDCPLEAVAGVVGFLLDRFGPSRLMFASDWPMTELHSSYRGWWDMLQGLLDRFGLSAGDRHAIFCATANRAHRLGLDCGAP